jgi:signal peptide peptidase SppA
MKRFIPFMKSDPMVAVVRLSGVIAAGGRGLNDAGIAPVLEKAFSRGKPKAVALVLNSPGGSPVQSSLIGARIRRLAEEKEIPVFAFVEDVAASGGYWLASAADEIYVDDSSIVGSIGVISASFGFHELLGRYGVERRIHTAGNSKSFMDPFSPEKPEDVERLKDLQQKIHTNFINQVTSRRGAKLPEGRDLADHVGHLKPAMKDRFGDKVKFAVYGQKRSILQRFGTQIMSDVLSTAEERAMYAQFGL